MRLGSDGQDEKKTITHMVSIATTNKPVQPIGENVRAVIAQLRSLDA